MPTASAPALIETFIARWDGTAMAEQANAQPFLSELCDVLGVPRPDPAQGGIGPYRFERNVTHYEADGTAATRRIDLYRRACFVCEAKQGAAPHRQATPFTREMEAQRRANVCNTPAWARHRRIRPARLAPMLEALAAMGQARDAGGGRYVT